METEVGLDDMVSLWYRALSAAVHGVGLSGEAGSHPGLSVIQASMTGQPISMTFSTLLDNFRYTL